MSAAKLDMHFCRRCGAQLTNLQNHVFRCANGHTLYANASPAVAVILRNAQGEVLMLERAINPGKGRLDMPGGFCDGLERAEDAAAREIQEELGLTPDQYTPPRFVMTGLDEYDYGGEPLPVLDLIFEATIKPDAKPVAGDDAASVEFMALQDIDLEKVQFPSIRAVIEKLKNS